MIAGSASASGFRRRRGCFSKPIRSSAHSAQPMSKPDRFKEEIGWLKALGGVLIACGVSLTAWLVQNYAVTSRFALFASLCALSGLAIGIAAIVIRLYRCFKILEAL
jgi:hypothetical protein